MITRSMPLAFDQSTTRYKSEDGHLHVGQSNISKSVVNPYWGREIPGYEDLGLDPDKKYMLWRHPAELQKAAATFNNLPILADHVPITADKHRPDLVIGSSGTDAVYQHPFLKNSLVFWTKPAIDAVESNKQKELSCAYHYTPVMTPGVTPDGQKYDGIMTGIKGNHIALVEDGRAGADVVVGDSAFDPTAGRGNTRRMSMAKLTPAAQVARSAVWAWLEPRLAQDAKIDYSGLVAGVTSKNFKAQRTALQTAIGKAVKGRLAQDADIEDLAALLNALSPDVEQADQMTTLPNAGLPPGATEQDGEPEDILAKIKKYLEEEGVSLDIINNLDAFAAEADGPPNGGGPPPPGPNGPPENGDAVCPPDHGAAADGVDDLPDNTHPETIVDSAADEEEDEEEKKKKAAAEDEDDEEDKDKAEDAVVPQEQENIMTAKDRNLVTRAAMDKAIKLAQDRAIRNQREIRDAERFVRPWVGDMAMDAAAPADIFRGALQALGVKGADKMHPDALRPVLEAQPKPSVRSRMPNAQQPGLAADAQPQGSFLERFPDLGRITIQ